MVTDLKTYPASWEGRLILACRKCQKKLKRDPDQRSLARLKKTVKRYNKEHPARQLHVINVPCMDLCPKGGVTVCCPTHDPSLLSIMRRDEDLRLLCCRK
jgi:predicted metal-binding protein